MISFLPLNKCFVPKWINQGPQIVFRLKIYGTDLVHEQFYRMLSFFIALKQFFALWVVLKCQHKAPISNAYQFNFHLPLIICTLFILKHALPVRFTPHHCFKFPPFLITCLQSFWWDLQYKFVIPNNINTKLKFSLQVNLIFGNNSSVLFSIQIMHVQIQLTTLILLRSLRSFLWWWHNSFSGECLGLHTFTWPKWD